MVNLVADIEVSSCGRVKDSLWYYNNIVNTYIINQLRKLRK